MPLAFSRAIVNMAGRGHQALLQQMTAEVEFGNASTSMGAFSLQSETSTPFTCTRRRWITLYTTYVIPLDVTLS